VTEQRSQSQKEMEETLKRHDMWRMKVGLKYTVIGILFAIFFAIFVMPLLLSALFRL